METTAAGGKQGSFPFHEASGAKEFANMTYFLDYMIAFQEHAMKNYHFKEMPLRQGGILWLYPVWWSSYVHKEEMQNVGVLFSKKPV